MSNELATAMFLHGGIVLLIGNLCGIPFGMAISQKKSDDVVRGWRVAHSGITSGGAVILAMGGALFFMKANGIVASIVAYSMIVSGYGFSVALPIGAQLGYRGLPRGGSIAKRLVYLGNLAGALGSLVGSVAFVWFCMAR
jgi:hypothetical protein